MGIPNRFRASTRLGATGKLFLILTFCSILWFSAFRIIVSGSKDGSCIVWDLSKLSFIRQLGPHPGPVSAVCVNEVTVSLV